MDRRLTLVEHLGELRRRIIISLVALGLGTAASLPLASTLLKALKRPAGAYIEKLAFFSPQDAFLIYMRLAFVSGLIISMPVIFYQVWGFVGPAIEDRFKRYSTYLILFGSIFFLAGCLFAYFILIPPALKFLLSFAGGELEPVISASHYISFVTALILGGGLVFQMPILSFIFTRLGLINARLLRKKYKYALVAILIAAAIITPTPDAFNMFILALPMVFLYEISIWISFFLRPRVS